MRMISGASLFMACLVLSGRVDPDCKAERSAWCSGVAPFPATPVCFAFRAVASCLSFNVRRFRFVLEICSCGVLAGLRAEGHPAVLVHGTALDFAVDRVDAADGALRVGAVLDTEGAGERRVNSVYGDYRYCQARANVGRHYGEAKCGVNRGDGVVVRGSVDVLDDKRVVLWQGAAVFSCRVGPRL